MILGYDAGSNVMDTFCVTLDDGYILFHDSGDDEVSKPQFNDPAFGDAEEGSATMNTGTSVQDSNSAGGTINHAHLTKQDGTIMAQATCGLADTEFIFSSLTVAAGESLTITLLTCTVTTYPLT